MTKKWFLVPGFIGIVFLIAGFLIQDCLLFLFKWNLITRYPVIFNFRVGTGRVLKKKFGTGRVPGSRRTLALTPTHPLCPSTDNAHIKTTHFKKGLPCKRPSPIETISSLFSRFLHTGDLHTFKKISDTKQPFTLSCKNWPIWLMSLTGSNLWKGSIQNSCSDNCAKSVKCKIVYCFYLFWSLF